LEKAEDFKGNQHKVLRRSGHLYQHREPIRAACHKPQKQLASASASNWLLKGRQLAFKGFCCRVGYLDTLKP
jgi:hypothetical protein